MIFNLIECCPENQQYTQDGTCVNKCSQGYFIQANQFTCLQCQINCLECSTTTNCAKCDNTTALFQQQCVEQCPADYRKRKNKCLPLKQISDCSIKRINRYENFDGECVTKCPFNGYINPENFKCELCVLCPSCTGPQQKDCIKCHVTCDQCSGEGFQECGVCTRNRDLVQFKDRPQGECNCRIINYIETLEPECQQGNLAYNMKETVSILSYICLISWLILSCLQSNPLVLLNLIDVMQHLSFYLFINAKEAVNIDEILYQLVLIFHPSNILTVQKQKLFIEEYTKQTKSLYLGNPKFFSSAARTSLFVINGFELMLIHSGIWAITGIVQIGLFYYGQQRTKERQGILKLQRVLSHTVVVHTFLLTIQEFSLCVIMQFANSHNISDTTIGQASMALAIITFIYFVFYFGYFLKRHYLRTEKIKKIILEQQSFEEILKQNGHIGVGNQIVISKKQVKGITSLDNIFLFFRKFIVSVIITTLYDDPIAQSILTLIVYCLYFIFFIKSQFDDTFKAKIIFIIQILSIIAQICIAIGAHSQDPVTKVNSAKAVLVFLLIIFLIYLLYAVFELIKWAILYKYTQTKPDFSDYDMKIKQTNQNLFQPTTFQHPQDSTINQNDSSKFHINNKDDNNNQGQINKKSGNNNIQNIMDNIIDLEQQKQDLLKKIQNENEESQIVSTINAKKKKKKKKISTINTLSQNNNNNNFNYQNKQIIEDEDNKQVKKLFSEKQQKNSNNDNPKTQNQNSNTNTNRTQQSNLVKEQHINQFQNNENEHDNSIQITTNNDAQDMLISNNNQKTKSKFEIINENSLKEIDGDKEDLGEREEQNINYNMIDSQNKMNKKSIYDNDNQLLQQKLSNQNQEDEQIPNDQDFIQYFNNQNDNNQQNSENRNEEDQQIIYLQQQQHKNNLDDYGINKNQKQSARKEQPAICIFDLSDSEAEQ